MYSDLQNVQYGYKISYWACYLHSYNNMSDNIDPIDAQQLSFDRLFHAEEADSTIPLPDAIAMRYFYSTSMYLILSLSASPTYALALE
jgi:hypothetical protein